MDEQENWEEIKAYETYLNNPIQKWEKLTQFPNSCQDAWGARIENTLLSDLSESERRGLAEHAKTCSACAERLEMYQFVEEFAKEYNQYDLADHSKVRYKKLGPHRRIRRSFTLQVATFFTYSTIVCCVLLIVGILVEKVRLLLVTSGSIGFLLLALAHYGLGWSYRFPNRSKTPYGR